MGTEQLQGLGGEDVGKYRAGPRAQGGHPRVRGGDVGRVDGGITEPQAAVGAKDTNRMT